MDQTVDSVTKCILIKFLFETSIDLKNKENPIPNELDEKEGIKNTIIKNLIILGKKTIKIAKISKS